MKHIRVEHLGFTAREMAEFLGLTSVTELERYESGDNEYPLPMLRRLEDFFFLSRRYLETGEYGVFKKYSLNPENVARFLREDFKPTLACSPDRANLFAYIVFSKKVDGFTRIAISSIWGSFVSSGGGKTNIQYLILALLEQAKSPHDVRIVKLDQDEWKAVSDGTYYREHPFPRAGIADYECMDIFDEWFKESAESSARWKRLESRSDSRATGNT